VYESRVLRRIFRLLRNKVTEEWKKLHNEELNDLHVLLTKCYSSDQIKKMRWAGYITRMGGRRGVYRVLVWKAAGQRPLGKPRHRWEGNVTMGLQKVGWGHGLNSSGSG
jgi:hypothetical protein